MAVGSGGASSWLAEHFAGIPQPVSMLNKLDRAASFATSASNFQNLLAVSSQESHKSNAVTVTPGTLGGGELGRLIDPRNLFEKVLEQVLV